MGHKAGHAPLVPELDHGQRLVSGQPRESAEPGAGRHGVRGVGAADETAGAAARSQLRVRGDSRAGGGGGPS